MKKIIIVVSLLALTSCGVASNRAVSGDRGYIEIHADSEGMREWANFATGLVNETKTTPDTKSSHYQMREEQEITKRQALLIRLPKSRGSK